MKIDLEWIYDNLYRIKFDTSFNNKWNLWDALYHIIELDCSNSELIMLYPMANIVKLNCSHNRLTELPVMRSLVELDCSYNYITEISNLLVNLKRLNCDHNKLTSIPGLENLFILHCENNNIQYIYSRGLTELYCRNNNITDMPYFPWIKIMYCNGNNIQEGYDYEDIEGDECGKGDWDYVDIKDIIQFKKCKFSIKNLNDVDIEKLLEKSFFDIIMQTNYTVKDYLEDDKDNIIFVYKDDIYGSNINYLKNEIKDYIYECKTELVGMPKLTDIIQDDAYIPLNLDPINTSIRVSCLLEIIYQIHNGIKIIKLLKRKKTNFTTNIKNIGIKNYQNIFNEQVDLVSSTHCNIGSEIYYWSEVSFFKTKNKWYL
jgi:Leucine-rich repeat (LRR) protein